MTQRTLPKNGTPADRGSADAYYGRPMNPHKLVGGREVTELTYDETCAYEDAYENEDDRKNWR